jgi:hypothetical protein
MDAYDGNTVSSRKLGREHVTKSSANEVRILLEARRGRAGAIASVVSRRVQLVFEKAIEQHAEIPNRNVVVNEQSGNANEVWQSECGHCGVENGRERHTKGSELVVEILNRQQPAALAAQLRKNHLDDQTPRVHERDAGLVELGPRLVAHK